jgi:hypothetical protein
VIGRARGGSGDDLVGEQVGAGPVGLVVARRGDEEFPGRVEIMGIPSGLEHSLPKDQVYVPGLADAEAYPQVYLGPHRAGTHGLLRRPLGSRDKPNGERAARRVDSELSSSASSLSVSAGSFLRISPTSCSAAGIDSRLWSSSRARSRAGCSAR